MKIKVNEYLELRGEIFKQKKLRGLRDEDLSNMTGYSRSYINQFLHGEVQSEKLANRLSEVLEIVV